MKNDKLKLALITLGSVITTALLFWLFFWATTFGFENGHLVAFTPIGDSYCKFGPIPAKYASFDVRFRSNFTGQLTLVDKKGKQLSNNDYSVLVNGKSVGTSFKAPGTRKVSIKIRGNSNKVAGRTFVRVKGGGPFITHYYFHHHSNPFVYYLIFIITAILFVIVLWYVFLQRVFYPRFKAIKKTLILDDNNAPISIKFKGARMVVIDSKKHEQSWINRIITGPIIYKTTPVVESEIVLLPRNDGKQILFLNKQYICTPNPFGLQPATALSTISKSKILIN